MKQDEKTYPFKCPLCGYEMRASLSVMMECGVNLGSGQCLRCGCDMHLEMNESKEQMNAIPRAEFFKTIWKSSTNTKKEDKNESRD